MNLREQSAECQRFWRGQQATAAGALDKIVAPGSPVAYLDYPVHRNVGDLMIYLGTWRWLEASGRRVLCAYSQRNFRFHDLPQDTVFLFHGGGHFGDLYPEHQRFRESVVKAYRRQQIVFLPQTLFYRDDNALARSAQVLETHPDVHLCWRDRRSLDLASERFPSASGYLVPDMASFLFPIDEGSPPALTSRSTSLHLLRRDLERGEADERWSDCAVTPCDWPDLVRRLGIHARAWQALHAVLGGSLPAASFELRWRALSRAILRRVTARFLEADDVVTSRLHGHLLACLLGIPNTLLDNCYGKNRAYYETWTQTLSFADFDPCELSPV